MNKKIYLFVLVLTLMIISIIVYIFFSRVEDSTKLTGEDLLFIIENNNIEYNIKCYFDEEDNNYYVFMPNFAEIKRVKILCKEQTTISIGENIYKHKEYIKNINENEEYELIIRDKSKNIIKESKIQFLKANDDIATMFVNTVSGSMDNIYADKSNKEDASMYLINESGDLEYGGKINYIKGRGNATWDGAKKGFKIQLLRSMDLLNLGEGKNWVLLANQIDKTNLRNKIVYDFAKDIGLDFSPDSQFVNLYLNGKYAGLYLLSEKVEIQPNRVDIGIENNDISGPYILEKDLPERYEKEKNGFVTDREHYIVIKKPDEITDKQKEYISSLWQEMENALYAEDDSYLQYIDLDSWVKKYLLEEIFGNFDANITSMFFYKKNDAVSKLIYAGPVWDYDGSMGSFVEYEDPQKYIVNIDKSLWKLLLQKEEFRNEVVRQYNEVFVPKVNEYLNKNILELSERVIKSTNMDYKRWKNTKLDHSIYVFFDNYQDNLDYIRNFIKLRLEFLDEEWGE